MKDHRKGRKGEVRVRLGPAVETGTEADVEMVLYQAVAKGTKMEFIIQKGTELGFPPLCRLLLPGRW